MSRRPRPPAGYDVAYRVDAGRPDCHITVGFDQNQQQIPRFLVQLHYQADTDPVDWVELARMDHNETSARGHDVYREGLHVDVARRTDPTVHLKLRHAPLPTNRGIVIRGCDRYFRAELAYFIDVYKGNISSGSPPRWTPDGGESTRTLIRENLIEGDMSRESSTEEVLSPEELSKVLAEATGTTAEEIERGAEEMEIAPPSEATVVDE
jgi:hypothetical protein